MECLLPVLWTIVYASICSRFTHAENFGNFKNILWSTCLESRKEALYFMKLSIQQCIKECALRSACEFLGYDMRLRRCGLYFNEDFNNKDEKGGTCAFIFRRDLNLQEIASVCSCNNGQVCSLNNGHCLIKECQAFYFNNGIAYGNVRHVNAKARIKCQDGYREINGVQEVTCNNDGYWSYLPSCVLQSSSTATVTPGPTTEETTTVVETTFSTTTTVGVTISTAATTGAQTPSFSTTTSTPSPTTVSTATTMAVTTITTTGTPSPTTTTPPSPTTTTTPSPTTTTPPSPTTTTTPSPTATTPPSPTTTTPPSPTTTTPPPSPTTTTPPSPTTTTPPSPTTTTPPSPTTTTPPPSPTTTTPPSSTTTTTTLPATTTTYAAPVTVCPSDLSEWITPSADYTSFQVLFVVQNAKRDQSQTGCAGHSSSLVKINALWKQNALAASLENCDVFNGFSSSCYWIEGFKSGSAWIFMDSSLMPMSGEFWDVGQPSSSGGQLCVSINSNQLWETKNCNNQCGYICERTLT